MRMLVSGALAALLLAGCASAPQRQAGPAPLTPAPAKPVQVAQLPELPPGAKPVTMAEVGPSAGSVTRETVLGQWRVASAGGSCQLNLTLTGWKGGSRASTRNCADENLSKVAAWSYDGGTVVLKDDSGASVARLAAQGETAMSGATAGGAPVLASRTN